MSFLLETTTVGLLNKFLEGTLFEHKLIANNIANIDTQGYKTQTIKTNNKFTALIDSLENTQSSASTINTIKNWVPEQNIQTDATANKIELEKELAKLSKNVIHYQAILSAKSKLNNMLTLAIKEGKS
ncbi:flagellar basal body rod protein FlgB [Zooshikella sp. RANM57]|uniref:flagellar basal body rod protein FlgB n=1 Tax=Zooshikella sp. RANM57 TaxID=3425863 RepID=UPI003D70060D